MPRYAIAINLLTKALGERLWENGLIVFTFANDIVSLAKTDHRETSKYFRERTDKFSKKIKTFLQEGVRLSPELVDKVKVATAGHPKKPLLPSINEDSTSISLNDSSDIHWLSNLWLKALSKTKHEAQPAMIKLNLHRMNTRKKEYTVEEILETSSEIIEMQPIILAQKGAEIGKRIGDSGERIGTAIGREVGKNESINVFVHMLIKLAQEHGLLEIIVSAKPCQ